MENYEAAARALGLKLQYYGVKGPEELSGLSFAAITKGGRGAPPCCADGHF